MNTEIKIRIANKKDAELIADLSRQTFYHTYAAHNSNENMKKFMNTQFSKKNLMAEVDQKENIFLLAGNENRIVGYAKITEEKTPELLESGTAIQIARIYSVTEKIGKGVGSALMQKCIDLAKKKNKKVIWLGVWKKNKRAIDFYIKWGFEIFDEQEFTLGNDVQKDWLMKKEL
jgi:ribosomal protein S18 acetylase RimI-like enzyme